MNETEMLVYTQDLRTTLQWHLQSNHFPPVPIAMMEPCLEAIDAANEEDWDRLIDLPENTSYRGRDQAPAWAIIEAHHLSGFLAEEDE